MDPERVKNKDSEEKEMVKEFEAREAGVAELAAVYERIERKYIETSQTLPAEPPTVFSNSANPAR